MRACVVESLGGSDCIAFTKEHPSPSYPESGAINIRVHACALGSTDVDIREGRLKMAGEPPIVPGYEISGVVESVGESVDHIQPGDEIFGLVPCDSKFGGCCDVTQQSAFHFIKKPRDLSHEDAASCVAPGLCAFDALKNMGHDDSVLVVGGTTAIGHIMIQLATHRGGRVMATVSNDAELNYLQDLPAKHGLVRVIHSRSESVRDIVLEETGGLGAKYIIVCGSGDEDEDLHAAISGSQSHSFPGGYPWETGKGPETSEDSAISVDNSLASLISCLSAFGHIFLRSASMLDLSPADSETLMRKSASVAFMNEQTWVLSSSELGKFIHLLESVREMLQKGVFQPKRTMFQLNQIRMAHRTLSGAGSEARGGGGGPGERPIGRVVVRVSETIQ